MSDEAPVVVDAEWLARNLDRVRVVDVREPWEFDGIGHVPGAVSIPFDAFRGSGDEDEGMLPGADRFEALLGEAGISPDDALVAYDDEHGVFAARFVVTALMYGHDDVRLLDGDYSAWSRDHETTTAAPDVEPVEYEATVPEDRPLIDAEGVLAAVDDPDAVLVDTRTREEYEAGHIEGAVRLDWRELVDPETRGLLDRDELLDRLADDGIVPERRVVLYCNTARRISHTYLALRHVGFQDVDFYEGSLTDWEARGLGLVSGE
jgi:thiosulfate/3-mercaptopyruvate sulfurtransferase